MKKIASTVLLAVMLFSLCSTTALADVSTIVYVNGVKLQTDTPPVIINDRTYVPFRAIAEALGCVVGYDETTKTVTMEGGGVSLMLTVGSNEAVVNGAKVMMDTPAMIVNNRTMVPIRFVSETFRGNVKWTPGYDEDWGMADNFVRIFSEFPVTVKPLGIGVYSKCFQYKANIGYQDGDMMTAFYDLVMPQFSGLGDGDFQAELNDDILKQFEAIDSDVRENEREQKEDADGYYYTYSEELDYSLLGVRGDILAVMQEGYWYAGGAHGMPNRTVMNIDIARNKVLQLPDLFKGANFEQRLLNEINALRDAESEYEGEIDVVTGFPLDGSFYFDGNTLVVFYHPYDLASYARGFVEFKIPLANLLEILKDEYK